MAPLVLLLCFSLLLLIQEAASDRNCNKPGQTTRCNPSGPEVRFPFELRPNRCGDQGFTLSCNDLNQTVLTLPKTAAEFTVQSIDYASQTVSIKDPGSCLPRRFLDSSFDLSRSPFALDSYVENFTFVNCPSNVTAPFGRPVRCLSDKNYKVWAFPRSTFYPSHPQWCWVLGEVSVPDTSTRWSESNTKLRWSLPNCRGCEANGGTCGFKSDSDLSVSCFTKEKKGLPRALKYGLTLGLGIPSLMCFVGVISCLLSRVKAYRRRRRNPNDIEFAMSVLPQPAVTATGLDEPTIESYPKTILGESRRLPNTNDNTCAICLSEYEPKDTLRTIPECNHYFHADCIDEWLRMKSTCPLCRKTPESSNIVTPSSSISSSSSTLSPR